MRSKALLGALLLVVAACGGTATPTTVDAPTTTVALATTTTEAAAFPLTVAGDNGEVTIPSRPERIISLSSVATEMLFAIGAGDQVVAVDDQSNYPPDVPRTDLSGFTPNLEAIRSYRPDLVVISYEPGDLIPGLEAVGVTVLQLDATADFDGTYRQLEVLGAATGHVAEAAALVARIRSDLEEIVAGAGGLGDGVTYYHEVDASLYTVTSATFFGRVYALFGMVNVADPADTAGVGYPQLSSEYLVAADPQLIFLANTAYGESAETVAARPGWAAMTAVESGAIVELDSDVASRWGPRVVDLARAIATALRTNAGG